jgi:E3 ubiquitin-protein ligase DOA10
MNRNAPNQRPVISLGLSPVLVTVELLAAIAILLAVLLIVQFWAVLPDRIPIHFWFSRQPDA